MNDLTADLDVISPGGHTESIANYRGAEPLEAGLRVVVEDLPTEGRDLLPPETWEVLRVDEADGVFHMRRNVE